MEVDLLAEGVSPLLRIKPAVDDDGASKAEFRILRGFHLGAGEKESTHTLGIVDGDFFTDVVSVGAVAIGVASEA